MAKTYKLPEYVLYTDTNAAYSAGLKLFSPKFVKAVEQSRRLTPVEVRLSEVVAEELMYQKFKIAKSASDNLEKNGKTLSDLCGLASKATPNGPVLEQGIRKLFVEFVEANSYKIIPTPVDTIDWKSVVRDSCWRLPPFEKPKSEDDLAEKGFRDRLILETVKFDLQSKGARSTAFVSGDKLLKEALQAHLGPKSSLEIYSGIDEFVGNLELLNKTRSEGFAKEVLSRAKNFFYNPDDANCIAISKGVLENLAEKYGSEMSKPSILHAMQLCNADSDYTYNPFSKPNTRRPPSSTAWVEEPNMWSAVTPLKAFASPPVFLPHKTDGRYHWKTDVTLARLLRRNQPRYPSQYAVPEERIRLMEIEVFWSVAIDPNTAEFSDSRVEDYQPTLKDTFVEADRRTRMAYDIPMFPDLEELQE